MKGVLSLFSLWIHIVGWASASEGNPTTLSAPNGSKNGWTVNPIRLISPFVNTAKKVAPASVRHDIDLLKGLFKIKDAKWSIFHQRVVLDQCILRLEDQPKPALSIGRLDVHWDSLTTPTVDIEIEDVEINVEFTNMMMSRNNWNEINEGVAPLITSYESTSRWFGWDKPSEDDDDFLQFNNIKLLGNLTLALQSRPLGKELAKLSLKMSIEDLSDKIQKLAEKNFQRQGRRGCSTTELTDLLKQYFSARLRSLLKEIARDPQKAMEQKDHLVHEVQTLISHCQAELSTQAGESIRRELGIRIERAFAKVKSTIDAMFDRIEKGLEHLFDMISGKLLGDRSSIEHGASHHNTTNGADKP